MSSFARPRPIAWFCFIVAFGTCLALGAWQVQRLEWKQQIIAHLAEVRLSPPLTVLPKTEDELAALNFRFVKLSGTWRHDIEYHLTPRYQKSVLGYHILTPLQLKDGRIIIVNRGWVPAAKKEIEKRRETIVAGHATIKGMLRVSNERNGFTPINQPEKNLWFGRDVADMASYYELKNVIPATVDAIGEQDFKKLPIPSDGRIKLRNDHLSYIITWFSLAVAMLVIFVLYHRR